MADPTAFTLQNAKEHLDTLDDVQVRLLCQQHYPAVYNRFQILSARLRDELN